MKYFYALLCVSAALKLQSAAIPGTPRDSNTGNSGGYDSTKVEAQLVVQVDKNTDIIHFVRDNNDPRVITRTYELKYVEPYAIRNYLRQMVQSKRVGNSVMQQTYPQNTSSVPITATATETVLTPANTQMGYAPAVQLGSNTAVECLKYVDGTGLLIVSAEDYRFKDSAGGIGIDHLIKLLDTPETGSISSGSQMFIYMPEYVPAANLLPLMENVGMNISDVTELWQGQDIVTADSDLNWLIFDVSNYSCENISALLKKYDVPIPQVRLKIKVYEIYSENDERIGIDFQSWKNNEGADFFSVGGRYRNNWSAIYEGAGLARSYGSERTSFFNFNPKWNSRYIDFLTAVGKAEVIHSGELCIRNQKSGTFSRTTELFYMDTSQNAANSVTVPGIGNSKWLSALIGEIIDKNDIPAAKANKQITAVSKGYGFTMQVNNVSVNLRECRFNVTLSNSSLIGFNSDGSPRISTGSTIKQDISLPFENGTFVIGGLEKKEVVKSRSGVPFLCDIPYLGYLFSTTSTSVKSSKLLVAAECSSAILPQFRGVRK